MNQNDTKTADCTLKGLLRITKTGENKLTKWLRYQTRINDIIYRNEEMESILLDEKAAEIREILDWVLREIN